MSIPLSFLRAHSNEPTDASLGDTLTNKIDESYVSTLLDCLCSTPSPAIFSPHHSRAPLCHDMIHSFIVNFVLPNSQGHKPLGPNDRIMIVLPTGPENALALMALASYHTCAPVNASCTAQELKEDADRLQAKAIVTTRDVESRLELKALSEELGCDVIFIEERSSGPAGLFDMSVMGVSDSSPRLPSRPHCLTDQSLVLHTSGTSGKKKVVPYTLRHLIVGTWAVVESWNLQPSDVNMNMMPLFHVGGIIRNLWAPLLSGGSAIMCSGFDAIAFWGLAKQLRATWYYAAPTIHHSILTSQPDEVEPSKDLKIRMICNAAGGLLPSLAVSLQERFGGAVILPSYGMTECMPISTPLQSYQLDRPGCSGLACGPYMSIRDPFNIERELPQGQTGAVCVKGLPTFSGYEVSSDITVPLDTSAFSSEGWFDGGDVGYMDEDGYLYVTGRSKEIINKGGEVISPFEVEEAIVTAAKEYVKTTLAFAVEHEVLQETIGVVIVPVANRPRIGLAQLQDLLHEHLHPSKWPFLIVYMEDLPKNSAGKPLRIKLSNRLGVGRLTDSVPPSGRHLEAEVPSPMAALTEPIKCSKVVVDLSVIERTIRDSASSVKDVAVRYRFDGSPEAFVFSTEITSSTLKEHLAQTLPGYCMPDPIYVLTKAIAKTSDGAVDFNFMEEEILQQNSSAMSPTTIIVRDVVAELLSIDPTIITGTSDFFLLGGNSLLLGKLSYALRKKAGVAIPVSAIFTSSTIDGIASFIDKEQPPSPTDTVFDRKAAVPLMSAGQRHFSGKVFPPRKAPKVLRSLGQYHPWSLFVQAFPFLFFYPIKVAITWFISLFLMAYLAPLVDYSSVARMGALLASICLGVLATCVVCPSLAIMFKWVVIGKYKRGTYEMWSTYHLRYWIVNQALRIAGRGIFSFHHTLYARLLGARVGRNVFLDNKAELGEYDLLTIEDEARIDSAVIRGFCVDRNGSFRLDTIKIGRGACINTCTHIAPGTSIAQDTVYGPHSSSHEKASPEAFSVYNRTLIKEPHILLRIFVAWPLLFFVWVVSYLPSLVMLWLAFNGKFILNTDLNSTGSVIFWFASPVTVLYYMLAAILRGVVTPVLQLILGLLVKRLVGLNGSCKASEYNQLYLLRRYLPANLLSREKLQAAFSVLGSHSAVVSVVYRAMGAQIGRRVYWAGSDLVCPEPELLQIGNDVMIGSNVELFTSDASGAANVVIADRAMIADRVVLLPGTSVGTQTAMEFGALGKRNGVYDNGSTWMGNDGGEAICFNKGSKEIKIDIHEADVTHFGRAYHNGEAGYFVFPYAIIVSIHIIMTTLSAAYWSVSAIAVSQLLKAFYVQSHNTNLFDARHWYQYLSLACLISALFVLVIPFQGLFALLWVKFAKWITIGTRMSGKYGWDTSSYCQRAQLHAILSRPIHDAYGDGGILASITGSAYMVWFYRHQGASIGKNCAIWAGGKVGLIAEPDLVEIGNDVSLDDCCVVAGMNSRDQFLLNPVKIGNGCAMRSGSQLLSGASMEDKSMLCEHALLTSGEIAVDDSVYIGWPGRLVESFKEKKHTPGGPPIVVCPVCRCLPDVYMAPMCGHLFCESCITDASMTKKKCPTCNEHFTHLMRIQPLFGTAAH